VFTAALFTMPKRWKQPKFLSLDEQIKCRIYINGINSALKRKGMVMQSVTEHLPHVWEALGSIPALQKINSEEFLKHSVQHGRT
jgi:hypothetical protein